MTEPRPGNFDSAKDARNHKNRALGRAVWFWLTMAFFVWLTFATPAISTVAILAKCLCMVMAIFYAIIALAQTANYWEDDMDGLIRPEDRWRF